MELVPVKLQGMDLNWSDGTTTYVIEKVVGFYDTPDIETHDEELVLTDGSLKGNMIIKSREIVLTGAVVTDTSSIIAAREGLAQLATTRGEMDLEVIHPVVGTSMTSRVHPSEGLKLEFISENAFRYQMTFRASDPRLYSEDANVTWITMTDIISGRAYPREYPDWQYGSSTIPNSSDVWNFGNIAAPVIIDVFGPLTETRIVSSSGDAFIRVAPLIAGEHITIFSDTLAAVAPPANSSRASYVLAGSAPMLISPYSYETWHVIGNGLGEIQLTWRSTWI